MGGIVKLEENKPREGKGSHKWWEFFVNRDLGVHFSSTFWEIRRHWIYDSETYI